MNRKFISILFFVVVGLASCNDYQKLTKSVDYELKLQKAIEYYNKKDYNKAQTLLEDLRGIYRGTDKAENVNYYYAYCTYELGEYSFAAYLFKTYAETFPNSKNKEEVEFLAAYCYYLISPTSSLDQTYTKSAIAELQSFIEKYPNSEKKQQVEELLDVLQFKLEKKAYENAMLYYKIMDYKAAIIALKNVLMEFPDTRFREEIMFTIVKSSYLLAENSVYSKQKERYKETIAEYLNFVDKFPDSKKIKEAEKIYTNSLKFIEGKNGL